MGNGQSQEQHGAYGADHLRSLAGSYEVPAMDVRAAQTLDQRWVQGVQDPHNFRPGAQQWTGTVSVAQNRETEVTNRVLKGAHVFEGMGGFEQPKYAPRIEDHQVVLHEMQRTMLEEAQTLEMLKNYRAPAPMVCTAICGTNESMCGPCVSVHIPVQVRPQESKIFSHCM